MIFMFYLFMGTGVVLMMVGAGILRREYSPVPTFSQSKETTTSTLEKVLVQETPQPTFTPQPTPTTTKTAIPYTIELNPKDQAEMILIPAGEFIMGSDAGTDPYFWGAEGPEHTVKLDTYLIYRTEVTNAMYQACVDAKACPRPERTFSATRESYFGNPQFSNYPVIYVSWTGALSYCQWADAKLPTEAQWEKASRGNDQRLFPWGDDIPNALLAHFNAQDTTEVGMYPEGASPFGILDMAGNVLEWVNDRFQAGYYSISPPENPPGPAGTNRRVIRGGAWHHTDISALRTVARASLVENYTGNDIGFRCAVSAP